MLLFFYVVMEMVFPFLLSTGVITTILMMNQIFEFIPFLQSTGVELDAIFQMILFSLPPVLMISVPISLMIGIYAGISRLSADSELIVMRAAGVSLSFFFKPALFLALLVGLMVMIQSFIIAPLGVKKLEQLKYDILKNKAQLKLNIKQINNFFDQKVIYIFDQNEDNYQGIFISDWDATNQSPIIEAKTGKIYMDDHNHRIIFKLVDGKFHYPLSERRYRTISFEQLDYDVTPPKIKNPDLPQRFKNNNEYGLEKIDMELTIFELYYSINQASNKKELIYFEYLEEFHGRIVTILSCICFAFFSVPMGIFNPRSPKTGNIIYMVFVLIIYFSLYAYLRSLVGVGDAHSSVLYLSLLFLILNGLYKYYKLNQNIDSIFINLKKFYFQLKYLVKSD